MWTALRTCEPIGLVAASARMTIGASRPLAPCTVITRTPPPRFAELAGDRDVARAHGGEEALERGLLALLVLEREIEELGEDVVDLVAEARCGSA